MNAVSAPEKNAEKNIKIINNKMESLKKPPFKVKKHRIISKIISHILCFHK